MVETDETAIELAERYGLAMIAPSAIVSGFDTPGSEDLRHDSRRSIRVVNPFDGKLLASRDGAMTASVPMRSNRLLASLRCRSMRHPIGSAEAGNEMAPTP